MIPDIDLDQTELTVFDTETTGLDPAGDRVIELAAIRVRAGRRISSFHTLVQPGRPVPEAASRVNGISDDMLAGAPAMGKVIPAFREFINGSCLCSYNAPFDMGFMRAEYRRAGAVFPAETPVIDVLSMARYLLPLQRHSLQNVARSLGIGDEQEHRAFSDVELTIGVLAELVSRLRAKDISTLGEYICLFGRGCGPYEEMRSSKMAALEQAISSRARVRIKYFSRAEARVSEREVIPGAIRAERDKVYLLGYCCSKNSERMFNVDGILKLRLLDQSSPSITEGTAA